MQIDAYTRIVLTVIAACLVYMVGKDLNLVPEARAQEGAPVTAVNIVEIGGAPVPAPAPPPVTAPASHRRRGGGPRAG